MVHDNTAFSFFFLTLLVFYSVPSILYIAKAFANVTIWKPTLQVKASPSRRHAQRLPNFSLFFFSLSPFLSLFSFFSLSFFCFLSLSQKRDTCSAGRGMGKRRPRPRLARCGCALAFRLATVRLRARVLGTSMVLMLAGARIGDRPDPRSRASG